MTDQDTSPEAVERLVERMRTAYGGQLYRDCTATLRALSAALEAERGWQTVAESNQQMAQSWQACAEIAGAERDKEHARAEAAEARVADWRAEYETSDNMHKLYARKSAELIVERDAVLTREQDANTKAMQHLRRAEAAEAEQLEQSRLLGMSAERELSLRTKLEAAEAERDALKAELAEKMSTDRDGEQTPFIDDTAGYEADFGNSIAEAIRQLKKGPSHD